MKNVLVAVALLLLTACLGSPLRNEVLSPATASAWVNVQEDYNAGLYDGLEEGDLSESEHAALADLGDDLTAALAATTRLPLMTIPWDSQMRPWAMRGVTSAWEANELGPNGAQILYQRIAKFTEAITKLQEIN